MSERTPKPKPKRPSRPRRRTTADQRSPWVYLAPAALLGAVTVITLILSSAGMLGHQPDGNQPPSTTPAGPVETLSVPQTAPPPEAQVPQPATTAAETAPADTTPATTAETTPAETTPATTAETTPATTAEATPAETTPATTTGGGGQHVKWTVKPGDTLFSIATQFGTSVDALVRLNPSIDPDTLQVGQEVVVR